MIEPLHLTVKTLLRSGPVARGGDLVVVFPTYVC